MQQLVKLSLSCLLALGCLGVASSSATPRQEPEPGRVARTSLVAIKMCVAVADGYDCSPKLRIRGGLGERWGDRARKAGVVSVVRRRIRCPGTCSVEATSGGMVHLQAVANDQPGDAYAFDGWRGACRGKAAKCRFRARGNSTRVDALFSPTEY
jgi:hypothetical protein